MFTKSDNKSDVAILTALCTPLVIAGAGVGVEAGYWRFDQVEPALVILLLAAMVVAVMQYRRMVVAYRRSHNSVASGARYMMGDRTSAPANNVAAFRARPNRATDGVVAPAHGYTTRFATASRTGTYAALFASQATTSAQMVGARQAA